MTPNDFLSLINGGSVSGIYLLEGPEEYKKEEALRSVREKLLVPGFEMMNESVYDSASLQEISDTAETLPFMSDKRLIIIKDPAFLSANEGDSAIKILDRLLSNPPETAVILLYCRGDVKTEKKAVKEINKAGRLVRYELLSEAELSEWTAERLKMLGHSIKPAAATELVYLTGRQMGRLEIEISKLADMAGSRTEITIKDINDIVVPDTEVRIFALVDNLVDKKMAEAYNTLKKLLDSGENPTHMLAMIIRQMRLLAHVAVLAEAGVPETQMAAKLSEKNLYPVKKANRLCRGISINRLINSYKKGVDAEFKIKKGQAEALPVLEEMMYLLYNLRK